MSIESMEFLSSFIETKKMACYNMKYSKGGYYMREEKENELKYNIETDKQNNFEVNETQSVYLTKDKKLIEKLAIEEEMERKFGCDDIEKLLLKTEERIEKGEVKYLTHDEVFSSLRRMLNEE